MNRLITNQKIREREENIHKAVSCEGTHHVLLSDVALHIAVWMLILEDLREGQIVGIPIKRHNALIVAAQLGQGHPIGLPC